MIPGQLAMLAKYRFSKLGLEFAHRVVIVVGPGLGSAVVPRFALQRIFVPGSHQPARLAVTVRMDVAMASRHLYP